MAAPSACGQKSPTSASKGQQPRAVEGRWVFHAELAAHEAGNLTLQEAFQLVCLYAGAEPATFEKAALRWHARYVTEAPPSLLQAQIALAALAELRAESEPAKKVRLGWCRSNPATRRGSVPTGRSLSMSR